MSNNEVSDIILSKIRRTDKDWKNAAGDKYLNYIPSDNSEILKASENILVLLYENTEKWTILGIDGVVYKNGIYLEKLSYKETQKIFREEFNDIKNEPEEQYLASKKIWFPNYATFCVAYNFVLFMIKHFSK